MQAVDIEAHAQKPAKRYRHRHIEHDRVVSQWRLSRHMFSELQISTSLTEPYT